MLVDVRDVDAEKKPCAYLSALRRYMDIKYYYLVENTAMLV